MTLTSTIATRISDKQSHRLVCSEIWGGIGAIDQEVSTAGLTASISSIAVGGEQGGDIHYLSYCRYDFLTRIAIADVRGHGESVTLVSSWVYAAVQAQMNTLDGDRILSELNGRIQTKGLEAMTTAAVLSHDRIRQRLYFCYAGHPPAMVWRPAQGWSRLEIEDEQDASNLPLGVRASATYKQAHIDVATGDRIVVFTDGLLDAEDSDGEAFGEERLLLVLNRECGLSTSAIKYAILDGLLAHTGSAPLEDDLTVLVAEIR